MSAHPGGPESLAMGDLPEPVAGPNDVVIAVRAASVNHSDLLTIAGSYQISPPRPFAPGSEAAGRIHAVGARVRGLRVGQRVVGWAASGAFAERMLVPAHDVAPLPDGESYVDGAALVMTYGTAYHALVDRAGLRAGERVLVLGGSSGVGTAAIEIALALGADVVATASDDTKAELARGCGAATTVVLPRSTGTEHGAILREQGPVDVVVDVLGGDLTEAALRTLRWGGRHLVIGFAAGIPRPPLNLTLLKGTSLVGVWLGGEFRARPDSRRRIVDAVLELRRSGRITPRVTATYPLEDGGAALTAVAERTALGKLVLTVGRV